MSDYIKFAALVSFVLCSVISIIFSFLILKNHLDAKYGIEMAEKGYVWQPEQKIEAQWVKVEE